MPTTRIVDTVHILARLTALHKTVRLHANTNREFDPNTSYNWAHKGAWTVELIYEDDSTKLEIKAEANTFDEALQTAWARFETACKKGAGTNILMPPVEQRALPNGAESV